MPSFKDFDKNDYIFLLCLFLMRISLGFFATVIGITLLDLAQNVGVNQKEMSPIVTAKSLGSMIGAIFISIYQHYLPFENDSTTDQFTTAIGFKNKLFDRSTIMGITQFFGLFFCLLVPLADSVLKIVILIILTGILYGIVDIGCMAMVVDTWGNQLAGSMVQLYSFGWVIGSFVGPFLFAPFQEVSDDSDICNVTASDATTIVGISTSGTEGSQLPSVFWPWFITGLSFAIQSMGLIYAGISNLRRNLKQKYVEISRNSINNRQDSRQKSYPNYPFFRYDLYILLSIYFLYFTFGSSGHLYFEYVYSYAVCIRKFSNTLAASLNSAYFAAQAVARLLSVVLAAYINSKWMLIIFGIAEALSAILIFLVRGTDQATKNLNDILFFVGTCLLGFASSPLYGAGVAVSQDYLNMTRIYQCLFALGNYSGQLAFLGLGGDLVIEQPNKWLALSAINNLMVCLAIFVLVFGGSWLQKFVGKKYQNIE